MHYCIEVYVSRCRINDHLINSKKHYFRPTYVYSELYYKITKTSRHEIKNVCMAGITFKNYILSYDFFGFKVFLCNYSFTNARIQWQNVATKVYIVVYKLAHIFMYVIKWWCSKEIGLLMHMGPEMIISHNFSYKRKLFAFDMGLD